MRPGAGRIFAAKKLEQIREICRENRCIGVKGC